MELIWWSWAQVMANNYVKECAFGSKLRLILLTCSGLDSAGDDAVRAKFVVVLIGAPRISQQCKSPLKFSFCRPILTRLFAILFFVVAGRIAFIMSCIQNM